MIWQSRGASHTETHSFQRNIEMRSIPQSLRKIFFSIFFFPATANGKQTLSQYKTNFMAHARFEFSFVLCDSKSNWATMLKKFVHIFGHFFCSGIYSSDSNNNKVGHDLRHNFFVHGSICGPRYYCQRTAVCGIRAKPKLKIHWNINFPSEFTLLRKVRYKNTLSAEWMTRR